MVRTLGPAAANHNPVQVRTVALSARYVTLGRRPDVAGSQVAEAREQFRKFCDIRPGPSRNSLGEGLRPNLGSTFHVASAEISDRHDDSTEIVRIALAHDEVQFAQLADCAADVASLKIEGFGEFALPGWTIRGEPASEVKGRLGEFWMEGLGRTFVDSAERTNRCRELVCQQLRCRGCIPGSAYVKSVIHAATLSRTSDRAPSERRSF